MNPLLQQEKKQIFATYHTKYFTLTFFFYILLILIFKQQKHGLNNKKTHQGWRSPKCLHRMALKYTNKGVNKWS